MTCSEAKYARKCALERCQVCRKDSNHCDCQCPQCGYMCFDDVTLADHGVCYDCHHHNLSH